MASGAASQTDPPFSSKQYTLFQNDIYREGFLHNKLPIVTTDPQKLEEQAKAAVPITSFNYVAGGAGAQSTMDANLAAFKHWQLIPRMLQPTKHRDLRVNLFGTTYG